MADRLMVGEPDTRPLRLVVMASGSGSNLQAVIDASASGRLAAEVVAVISDRHEAFALERARQAGIPPICAAATKTVSRRSYDSTLAKTVAAFSPDFVLLLGWMRLLSNDFLHHFPGRVVNIHPAFPGAFPGTHALERAFRAFKAGEIDRTGVMIHFVPDEGIDDGPVIAISEVRVFEDDDLPAFERRVHETEHRLLIETVIRLTGDRSKE